MDWRLILEFLVIVGALAMGARTGGVGLGLWGAVGLLVLIVGFDVAPANIPGEVLLIVLTVIMAASAMEVAGGIDFLVGVAEGIIRPAPVIATWRKEHDLLGERELPDTAYYGVQTLRGMENFPLSGIPLRHFQHFVRALAFEKKAAAAANSELGVLDLKRAEAIGAACDEIITGHSVYELVLEKNLLIKTQLDDILKPENMTHPRKLSSRA